MENLTSCRLFAISPLTFGGFEMHSGEVSSARNTLSAGTE